MRISGHVTFAIAATLFALLPSLANAQAKLDGRTVKIGCLAPLTGKGAEWGQAAKPSMEIAAEEINGALTSDIVGLAGKNDGPAEYPLNQHPTRTLANLRLLTIWADFATLWGYPIRGGSTRDWTFRAILEWKWFCRRRRLEMVLND